LDVLLVDDEPSIRLPLGDAIRAQGHRVRTASNGAEAMSALAAQVFDVVVCDIRLPKVDGLTIFRKVRHESPSTEVLLITAYAEVPDAVAALKEGAVDYVTKPFTVDTIMERLVRIAKQRGLASAMDRARQTLAASDSTPTPGLVGRSPAHLRLLDQIAQFAASDAPVIISGESGTGKEIVARSLHEKSARRAKPFVAVNCAAFPDTLIEAELFGYEKGAFTGAVKPREGRFKAAHGGTLFLDEVAEIPLAVQAKLLRVLQTGVFEPLGTNESVRVDVRIVSATHRDLKKYIAAGLFREDLYYRLNVLDIEVPALRERRSDMPLLVEHFLKRFSPDSEASISPRALAALADYSFPGNIRELEHTIQRAVVLAGGQGIDLEHLPGAVAGRAPPRGDSGSSLRPLSEAVQEFEREYLVRALRTTGGKKVQAAELLGISRKSLWKKLRELTIAECEYQEAGAEPNTDEIVWADLDEDDR
jgi:DNA-binding NtrC family response regulator